MENANKSPNRIQANSITPSSNNTPCTSSSVDECNSAKGRQTQLPCEKDSAVLPKPKIIDIPPLAKAGDILNFEININGINRSCGVKVPPDSCFSNTSSLSKRQIRVVFSSDCFNSLTNSMGNAQTKNQQKSDVEKKDQIQSQNHPPQKYNENQNHTLNKQKQRIINSSSKIRITAPNELDRESFPSPSKSFPPLTEIKQKVVINEDDNAQPTIIHQQKSNDQEKVGKATCR